MSIELRFETRESYLLVHASGEWTSAAAKNAIRQVREESTANGLTHILIDCFKISPPDAELTRYFMGEAFASDLGRPLKVAAVISIQLINKFVENVARNRGARFLVSHDYESALEWLCSK